MQLCYLAIKEGYQDVYAGGSHPHFMAPYAHNGGCRGEPRVYPTRVFPGKIFKPEPRNPGLILEKTRGKMDEKSTKISHFC